MSEKLKLFSVLGDSVSTLFGYSQPPEAVFYTAEKRCETEVYSVSDTWWGQVIAALGGRLLANNSFSGSTVSFDFRNEIPSYGCSDARTSALIADGAKPDVILIFMGLNDRGLGVPIYPANEEEKNDFTVFSAAYSEMLRKLRVNAPSTELWCLTLPLGVIDGYEPSESAKKQTEAYSMAIAKSAAQNGCRVIDICRMKPYESIDGLHPNAGGMRQIAEAALAVITRG